MTRLQATRPCGTAREGLETFAHGAKARRATAGGKAMGRWLRTGAMSLALWALAACGQPPEFTAALSEPGTAEIDRRILGQWYIPNDTPWYAQIKSIREDGTNKDGLGISVVVNTDEGPPVAFTFKAHASSLDGELYYNVKRTRTATSWDYTAAGEKPGHIVTRVFHLTPDLMLVCGLMALPKGYGAKAWRKWFSKSLDGTGLTPRFADVVPRVNGRPVKGKGSDQMLHTLIGGERADLIRLVTSNPAVNFRAMMLLARIGSPKPAGDQIAKVKALMEKHREQCNIGTLKGFFK